MTLNQQVCSLELAKRLKELGVKQESYFWWVNEKLGPEMEFADIPREWMGHKSRDYSAYTVAELGEMLPFGCRSFQRATRITRGAEQVTEFVWRCETMLEQTKDRWPVEADAEANVRAKMLIHLLENKLITL